MSGENSKIEYGKPLGRNSSKNAQIKPKSKVKAENVLPPPPATSKAKGLGDVIESVTYAVGLQPCEGCTKRKDWLNVVFPFHRVRRLTAIEIEDYKALPATIQEYTELDFNILYQIYNQAWNTAVNYCKACSGMNAIVFYKVRKLYTNQQHNGSN